MDFESMNKKPEVLNPEAMKKEVNNSEKDIEKRFQQLGVMSEVAQEKGILLDSEKATMQMTKTSEALSRVMGSLAEAGVKMTQEDMNKALKEKEEQEKAQEEREGEKKEPFPEIKDAVAIIIKPEDIKTSWIK